jgi:hypothetical protein
MFRAAARDPIGKAAESPQQLNPGIEPIAGEAAGFVLGISEPGDAIYITGDTVWYESVAEVARRFRPAL